MLGMSDNPVSAARLLQAQTAHVASVVPRLGFAQELAEFNHILDDPFAGFEVVGGAVEVPGAAGSGARTALRRSRAPGRANWAAPRPATK